MTALSRQSALSGSSVPPRDCSDAKAFDPGTLIDALFETHGWARSWRDTVYDFVHYHSQIHGVMGVARGRAKIECGGIKGRVLLLKAGDVLVLPAGTGHRLIDASRNFLVVGAYPEDGTYDECTDTRECAEAAKRAAKVRKPSKTPCTEERAADAAVAQVTCERKPPPRAYVALPFCRL